MRNRITRRLGRVGDETGAAVREMIEHGTQDLERGARQAMKRSGAFIAENPLVCLAAAAAVGIALGWWMKRR